MKGIVQAVSLQQGLPIGGAPGDPLESIITVSVTADPAVPATYDRLNNLSFTLAAGAAIPTVGNHVDVTAAVTP